MTEQVATYDPAIALAFFKAAGRPEQIAEGAKIFAENEREIPLLRRNKVYFLLKGEVGLVAAPGPGQRASRHERRAPASECTRSTGSRELKEERWPPPPRTPAARSVCWR